MRVDVLGLQAFIAIADHGSFQAAAKALNLSQTALSHRIAKIEADLGLSLFVRTTRKLALTHEGLALLPRARRAIVDLEKAMSELKQLGELRRQEVTLGCIPSLATSVLAEVLTAYAEQMPQVRVRVHDGYARVIAAQVNGGEVEFGLAVRMGTHYELDFKPIVTERFVAVCRVDHPLAGHTSVSWDELKDHRLIGNTVINQALRMSAHQPYWDYEVETISTAVSFVKQGLGVTLLPAFEQYQPGYRELRKLPVTGPEVTRQVCFMTRPDMPLSKASQVLMASIETHLKGLAERENSAAHP
ncbi:LysR family transcriptional regulator [Pararhodobacter zhoushanensis]|uniref:LysR family transcriptional regulator n=1 Tax=Pararhodobacter zhoushanensis TaxID=2479545 RepID=UPI0013DE7AC0|nr:LysR family transcriptional regulator [Pararhodobacter zhoushanensis]